MKYLLILAIAMFSSIFGLFSSKSKTNSKPMDATAVGSLHDFTMKTLDGKDFSLSQYKGKKVVLINVASKCGYTPQYANWQKFHEAHGDKVVVLGFPANNFLAQEPGSSSEIGEFCQKNYGVSFQMFEKVDVVGKKQHPLYQWLSQKEKNGWNADAPSWNFCKYVVDENGKLTHFFASKITPDNEEFKKAVGL